MKRSAGRGRFDDLLRREGEEERHADIVDDEMDRVSEALVVQEVDIRPEKSDNRANDQQTRAIDEVAHPATIVAGLVASLPVAS